MAILFNKWRGIFNCCRLVAAAVAGCCVSINATAFTTEQVDALKAVNSFRAQAHLPAAVLNATLCRAAQAHAGYRIAHTSVFESPHEESSGLSGFTGRTPYDRMVAAGYEGNLYMECISMGLRNAEQSVGGLIRVPYHRLSFLEGDELEIGVGEASGQGKPAVWVFDMSGSVNTVSLWPPDGATGISIGGKLHESPDPLAIHNRSGGTVGYVVSASFNVPYTLARAKLTSKDGKAVDIFVNHSSNDPMCDRAVFIIPAHLLQPNTEYQSDIQIHTQDGYAMEYSWKFKTGDADAPASNSKLHPSNRARR